MSKKHLMTQVDRFDVRSFQHLGMTFGEVSKDGKPHVTMCLASDQSMWLWQGRSTKRNGDLKTSGRTVVSTTAKMDFQVEFDRLLYRAVATELVELAQSSF
jgi:hypothetical protein